MPNEFGFCSYKLIQQNSYRITLTKSVTGVLILGTLILISVLRIKQSGQAGHVNVTTVFELRNFFIKGIKALMNDLTNIILESVVNPIYIKNQDGIYVGCNMAFERILEISRNKILGYTAFDIVPSSIAQVHVAADKMLFAKRSVEVYKALVGNSSGQPKMAIFSKKFFFDENKQSAGLIGEIYPLNKKPNERSSNNQNDSSTPNLSKREFDVLFFLSKGLTSKEIAKTLVVSNYTVAGYLKAIYLKLGTNNRVSAIVIAQKIGLL